MPQHKSLDDEVRHAIDGLDRIAAEMSNGRPSQPRHDSHVDQVAGIARRLMRAARGPGRPIHPPIARVGGGYLW